MTFFFNSLCMLSRDHKAWCFQDQTKKHYLKAGAGALAPPLFFGLPAA